MAKGKQIAEMTLRGTGMTFTPGPGNSTLVQVNLEGTSDHYGVVARSAIFSSAGGKQGTYTVSGAGYLPGGETVTGSGQGVFESTGLHAWKTCETFTFADGSRAVFEGRLDLAERVWVGQVYEAG